MWWKSTASLNRSSRSAGRAKSSSSNRRFTGAVTPVDVRKQRERWLQETRNFLDVLLTSHRYFMLDALERNSVKFEFLIRNWRTPEHAFLDWRCFLKQATLVLKVLHIPPCTILTTLCLKNVSTFKLSVTSSNLKRFSIFFALLESVRNLLRSPYDTIHITLDMLLLTGLITTSYSVLYFLTVSRGLL